jgi:hypothetical protein
MGLEGPWFWCKEKEAKNMNLEVRIQESILEERNITVISFL